MQIKIKIFGNNKLTSREGIDQEETTGKMKTYYNLDNNENRTY